MKRLVAFRTQLSAGDVRISGDFTGWGRRGIPLWHDGGGRWQTILSLDPGVYEYRLVVDGDWADHEEAKVRVTNAFGGENCILTVN